MRRSGLVIFFLAAMASLAPGYESTATAQGAGSASVAPEWFGRWMRGPASLLFTELDGGKAAEVRSEDQASEFLNRFWACRDANPETARNEYRLRFQERLAYVDREFATPSGERGWLTLPGRIYLLLGPPAAVKSKYHGAIAAGAFRDLTVWSYQFDPLGYSVLHIPMVEVGGTPVLLVERNNNDITRDLADVMRSAVAAAVLGPDAGCSTLSLARTIEDLPLRGHVRVGPRGTVLGDLRVPLGALYGRPSGDSIRIEIGLQTSLATSEALVIPLQFTAKAYAAAAQGELRILYWGNQDPAQQPTSLVVSERASGRRRILPAVPVGVTPEFHVAVAEILMTAPIDGALGIAFLEATEEAHTTHWLTSRTPIPPGREIPLTVPGLHLVAVS